MNLKKIQLLLCSALLSFNIFFISNNTANTTPPTNNENVEAEQQPSGEPTNESNESEESDASEYLIQLFCILDDPR